jgi:excisionase family DNA binding protein
MIELPLTLTLSEDQLAAIAEHIAAKLASRPIQDDEWLDSRAAAHYLGVHRDTLRRLAAEGRVNCQQDAPGCKLYFRRSDLDRWRACGEGRDAT